MRPSDSLNTNLRPELIWQPPENSFELTFWIDDSANKTYTQGELIWKGSFTYDSITRMLTHDASWGGGEGPYPTLWDDGPWNEGGHRAGSSCFPCSSARSSYRWCPSRACAWPSPAS